MNRVYNVFTRTIDPTKYDTAELIKAVDLDAYAVRDEAERRATLVSRKLKGLYRHIAELEAEQISLNATIEAAWKEIHK
jgi:hypothetical protein